MTDHTFRFDIFISYSRDDHEVVHQIAEKLHGRGIRVFLDKWHLIPGSPWQEGLEEALDDSLTCGVFVGASGLSAWQNEEMRAAIGTRVHGRRMRVIPVLLPNSTLPTSSHLPAFLNSRTFVDFRRSIDDSRAFDELLSGIHGQPPGPPDGAHFDVDECPFKGLDKFGPGDAEWFFGRDFETQQLLERLRVGRPVTVIGASGTGKSSVVLAGLLPALRAGLLDGSERWPIVVMTPSSQPLDVIGAKLAALSPAFTPTTIVQDLRQSERALSLHFATLIEQRSAERAILVIDQFEETFTVCDNVDVRHALFDGLAYASSLSRSSVSVVLTLRADYLWRCSEHRGLAQLCAEHQFFVTPMTETQLREVIRRPTEAAGLSLDAGLEDLAISEVTHHSGGLALLEHALMELWRRRQLRTLTLSAYREIGGVGGSLARSAEAAYHSLSLADRLTAKRVFLQLVEPGEDHRDTGRTVTLSMLAGELPGMATDNDDVRRVVDHFADARLLTLDAEQVSTEPTARLSHELLTAKWSRFHSWLEEDRAFLLWRRRLQRRRDEWNTTSRDREALLRGALLTEALRRTRERPGDIGSGDREFIERSRYQWRRQLTLKRASWVAVGLILIAAAAAIYTRQRDARAQQLEDRATAFWHELRLAESDLSENDVRTIRRLGAEEPAVRRTFALQLLSEKGLAVRFVEHAPVLSRAIVGMDDDLRAQLIDRMMGNSSNCGQECTLATIAFAGHISNGEAVPQIVATAAELIESQTGYSIPEGLTSAINEISHMISPTQAALLVRASVRRAIRLPVGSTVLPRFVSDLSRRLPDDDRTALADEVLRAFEGHLDDSTYLAGHSYLIDLVPYRVFPERFTRVIDALIEHLYAPSIARTFQALEFNWLAETSVALTPQQAERIIILCLDAISRSDARVSSLNLSERNRAVLASIGARLSSAQADRIAMRVIETSNLVPTHFLVLASLPRDSVRARADELTRRTINRLAAADPSGKAALLIGLGALQHPISAERCRIIRDSILGTIRRPPVAPQVFEGMTAIMPLCGASESLVLATTLLQSLAAPPQVRFTSDRTRAFRVVFVALDRVDRRDVGRLVNQTIQTAGELAAQIDPSILGAIFEKLEPADAQAAADSMLPIVESSQTGFAPARFAQVLARIPADRIPKQRAALIAILRAKAASSENWRLESMFLQALDLYGVKASEQDARELIRRILHAAVSEVGDTDVADAYAALTPLIPSLRDDIEAAGLVVESAANPFLTWDSMRPIMSGLSKRFGGALDADLRRWAFLDWVAARFSEAVVHDARSRYLRLVQEAPIAMPL